MSTQTKQKRIFDSVHGFIYLNAWEAQLVESLPFQRLHYIRQLGPAYLVYPGAVHSRFEHSLGVMEVATQIFDKLTQKRAFDPIPDAPYYRQVLRLAALCHDLGHLPFSHVGEQLLIGEGGHEKWSLRVIQSDYLKSVWEGLHKAYPGRDPQSDVIKLSLGESTCQKLGVATTFSIWDRVLCQIITGDFFGADRIDYLLRDAKYTGLSYGVFDYHQLIEMLLILPWGIEGELTLGVEENGIESCEALLLARHFMHKRIYQYDSVKAYGYHLARFMQTLFVYSDLSQKIEHYLYFTDNEVLAAINIAAGDSKHPGHKDAQAIFLRKGRVNAIEVEEGMDESKLEALKKLHNIPDSAIAWELSGKIEHKIGLNFPVRKARGETVLASSLSDMAIPTGPIGWIFCDSDYSNIFFTGSG